MNKYGIRPTLRTYHTLVSALASAGRVHDMECLYQQMLHKNVEPSSSIYGIMVDAYVRCENDSKVASLKKEMSEKGIAFDDTKRSNHELDRIIASPI